MKRTLRIAAVSVSAAAALFCAPAPAVSAPGDGQSGPSIQTVPAPGQQQQPAAGSWSGGRGTYGGGQGRPGGQAAAQPGVNMDTPQPGEMPRRAEERLMLGRRLSVDPAPVPADDRQRTREGIALPRHSADDASPRLRVREGSGGDAGRPYVESEEEAAIRIAERERRELRRLRDDLLDESIERLLPMAPEEIRSYKRRRDSVEGAVNPSPARMRTETRQISAVPGAAPQVVRLTGGYASTIMFQDATGAPWPVLSVVVGSPQSFAVSQPKVIQETIYEGDTTRNGANTASNRAKMEGGTNNVASNIVNIVPMTNHASSNLVVTLEGAPYPVVVHLLSESTALESRVDDALVVFRLDKAGPKATAPVLGPSMPGAVDEDLLSFVHGVPPHGAQRLKFEPQVPGVQLWSFGGKLYLRSMHQAVWPAWTASAAGDNVTVYAMPKAPSVVVSVNGRRVKMALAKPGEDQE